MNMKVMLNLVMMAMKYSERLGHNLFIGPWEELSHRMGGGRTTHGKFDIFRFSK